MASSHIDLYKEHADTGKFIKNQNVTYSPIISDNNFILNKRDLIKNYWWCQQADKINYSPILYKEKTNTRMTLSLKCEVVQLFSSIYCSMMGHIHTHATLFFKKKYAECYFLCPSLYHLTFVKLTIEFSW